MKVLIRFLFLAMLPFWALLSTSCKKDKFITDSSAKLAFSQDSVLFDTVFTSIGSSTRNFRILNPHKEKLKISSIYLEGGAASPYKINVDGESGSSFENLELLAGDSMYVFVQVKIDPNNVNTPLIVSDYLHFVVNGNDQKVVLEAWGQDAYYHYPDSAIYFKDGSYLAYSLVNSNKASYTLAGDEYVWKNDKPHVIYGFLVVDEKQKLKIPAGTKVYLNYKAGLWVYAGGQLQVLGQKGNEVLFTSARREREYLDEPGQWDRIWINEGSDQNVINYAIIKNGYIGVQAELLGSDVELAKKRRLEITNTKIQNMSYWGLYCLAYGVVAANNVFSNCQEHSVNILYGGSYYFAHNTIANYWNKPKSREKPAMHVMNYYENDVYPISFYMGNSIIDGKFTNEYDFDVKTAASTTVSYTISNCYMKTTADVSDAAHYFNIKKVDPDNAIKYTDQAKYDFSPDKDEKRMGGFVHPFATQDAQIFSTDINGKARNTTYVTAGAYELP